MSIVHSTLHSANMSEGIIKRLVVDVTGRSPSAINCGPTSQQNFEANIPSGNAFCQRLRLPRSL